MNDCLFCKIIKGEVPAEKIYEDDHVLAFLDIRPVNQGHTLVIPKTHASNVLESSDRDIHEVMAVIRKITPGILLAIGADGFNLGMNTKPAAGQVIFHTHFHIMPRFKEDGYELWHGKQASGEEIAKVGQQIRENL